MMKKLFIILLVISALGCTQAKKTIRKNTIDIVTHAVNIDKKATAVQKLIPKESKAQPLLSQIKKDAKNIANNCTNISKALDGVEDKASLSEKVLNTLLWAGPLALIVFVCVYFGVGTFVKPLFNRAGKWVSKDTQRAAEMDAKLEQGNVSIEEVIAAKRASVIGYSNLYKKKKESLTNEKEKVKS